MLRWWEGWVGVGMLTSCLISVTHDSIEHRNLLAHSVDSLDKNSGNCLCQACSPPAKFGIERRGHFEKEHVAACARECWRWNYNMCRFMLIYKRLQIPIKKTLPSYYTTSRSKNWQFLLKKHKRLSWHVLFRVGKQEKNWKRTCCSRLMKLKQQRAKKRLTINMCRFMLTLKFTANTNKKRHLFILPHVPQ